MYGDETRKDEVSWSAQPQRKNFGWRYSLAMIEKSLMKRKQTNNLNKFYNY